VGSMLQVQTSPSSSNWCFTSWCFMWSNCSTLHCPCHLVFLNCMGKWPLKLLFPSIRGVF
jgi:hypothetical protein